MDKFPGPEDNEQVIDDLIEKLAQRKEMDPQDILSDMETFLKLSREDENAKAYFEVLAEELGISLEELLEYTERKMQED